MLTSISCQESAVEKKYKKLEPRMMLLNVYCTTIRSEVRGMQKGETAIL